MPQALCGKRVTEFVQEVVLAIRTFRAAVAVLGDALSTIQVCPLGVRFARSATRLTIMSVSVLGLPLEFGKTN